jgi:putative Holliday junction resolvase
MITQNIQVFREQITQQGRLVAFDVGTKKIGVAISDQTRTIATPHDIYQRINAKKDVNKALSYVKENLVVGIVIGLPLNLQGEGGDGYLIANTFASKLSKHTTLPVLLYDERFTSKQSQQIMNDYGLSKEQKMKVEDKIAASFILQSALDHLANLN